MVSHLHMSAVGVVDSFFGRAGLGVRTFDACVGNQSALSVGNFTARVPDHLSGFEAQGVTCWRCIHDVNVELICSLWMEFVVSIQHGQSLYRTVVLFLALV